MEIVVPRQPTPRRHEWHPTVGRATILEADGSVAWESDWQENFLADEGEEQILKTFFLEQANVSKYLALLTAAPAEGTTMATMTELFAPPLNGYARQQINAGDWGAPALSGGDFQSTAVEKTFGPATAAWNGILYVAVVTVVNGTAGKFLLATPTSASTNIATGQSFKWTAVVKAQ